MAGASHSTSCWIAAAESGLSSLSNLASKFVSNLSNPTSKSAIVRGFANNAPMFTLTNRHTIEDELQGEATLGPFLFVIRLGAIFNRQSWKRTNTMMRDSFLAQSNRRGMFWA
jgi:hypothetical protein